MTLTVHPWTEADAKSRPIPELPEGSMVVVSMPPNYAFTQNWRHEADMCIFGYILPEPPARPAKPPMPKPGDVIPEGALLFCGVDMRLLAVSRARMSPIVIEWLGANGWHIAHLSAKEWDANVTYATPPEPVKGEIVLGGWCDARFGWCIGSGSASGNDTHRIILPTVNGDLPEGDVTCKIERIVK